MIDRLQKLCKWRGVMAGWHLGSKAKSDPGMQAMRDLMEKWLIMRAEMNAMTELLIEKGVVSQQELTGQLHNEAQLLDQAMERFFPGYRTTEQGIEIYDPVLAAETNRRLGFPP